MSKILRKVETEFGVHYEHICQGCKSIHAIPTKRIPKGPEWKFNGDEVQPTFSPSVKITCKNGLKKGEKEREDMWVPAVCHYHIRNGQIQYCVDCTHDLAGKNLPLVSFPTDGMSLSFYLEELGKLP